MLRRSFYPRSRINHPSRRIDCNKTAGGRYMKRDRIIVFLLRRRYLLAVLAVLLAAAMFVAACLPDLIL